MELQHIDGENIARERAVDPEDVARLAHEAAVLQAAVHPGVVEVARWSEGPPAVLDTRHVGNRTLERTLGLRIERLADLLATVAETIADLHDRGIAHGALDAAHIALGSSGEPVIFGFAHGSLDAGPAVRAADVVALGRLIEDVLGVEHQPPSTQAADLRLRSTRQTGCREALLAVADRIELSGHDTPCSARTVARSLRPLADGADDRVRPRRPLQLAARVAGASAGVAAVGAVIAILLGGGSDARRPSPAARTPSAPATCATTPTTGVDLDGDSCTDALVVEGATVRTSAGRFVLGDDDDEVLVADWDCDGLATAALLRRPEGQVFVFDRWSTPGEDERVVASLVDPAVTSLRAMGEDGCPILIALDDSGAARGVPLDAPPTEPPSQELLP